VVRFDLDQTLDGKPAGPENPVAAAIFSDHAPGTLRLLLLVQNNLGDRDYVSEWLFNFANESALAELDFTHVGGARADVIVAANHHTAGGRSEYDIRLKFPSSNHHRFEEGFSEYAITGPAGLSALMFDTASRWNWADSGPATAAYFKAEKQPNFWLVAADAEQYEATPEPQTLAFGATGLLFIALAAARRRERAR
jgi:hypothetical protein